MKSLLLAIPLLVLIAGCGEQPDLPASLSINPEDFGANDTTFVRVTPDWDVTHGYDWTSPNEIHIAADGFLYVADETDGGRVSRLERSGRIVRRDLFAGVIDTTGQPPIGLGQDSKLNLFMVDGGSEIYAHNVAVEYEGLAEIVQAFDVIDLRTGDRHPIDNASPVHNQYMALAGAGIDSFRVDEASIVSTADPDTLDFYRREYVFYREVTAPHPAEYSDIDGGPRGAGVIYAADQGNDRIQRLEVQEARVLVLRSGEVTYSFFGVPAGDAVQFGQGQSSTNNPTSVVSAGSPTSTRIYFTQVSGNFLAQRLRMAGSSWLFDIPARGDGPPLISLGYFGAPVDVAVGAGDDLGLGLFYVADSLQNRVTAYYSDGGTFRQVAAEDHLFDLEAGQLVADAVVEEGLVFDSNLNPDLVGKRSTGTVDIVIQGGETLLQALEGTEYSFDPALNPDLDPEAVTEFDRSVKLVVPLASTVKVLFPVLDRPRGVATLDGVVYIADSGNNRIVRYRRSDSDAYIPRDPNFP